jgi:hypothetical protein
VMACINAGATGFRVAGFLASGGKPDPSTQGSTGGKLDALSLPPGSPAAHAVSNHCHNGTPGPCSNRGRHSLAKGR